MAITDEKKLAGAVLLIFTGMGLMIAGAVYLGLIWGL